MRSSAAHARCVISGRLAEVSRQEWRSIVRMKGMDIQNSWRWLSMLWLATMWSGQRRLLKEPLIREWDGSRKPFWFTKETMMAKQLSIGIKEWNWVRCGWIWCGRRHACMSGGKVWGSLQCRWFLFLGGNLMSCFFFWKISCILLSVVGEFYFG